MCVTCWLCCMFTPRLHAAHIIPHENHLPRTQLLWCNTCYNLHISCNNCCSRLESQYVINKCWSLTAAHSGSKVSANELAETYDAMMRGCLMYFTLHIPSKYTNQYILLLVFSWQLYLFAIQQHCRTLNSDLLLGYCRILASWTTAGILWLCAQQWSIQIVWQWNTKPFLWLDGIAHTVATFLSHCFASYMASL